MRGKDYGPGDIISKPPPGHFMPARYVSLLAEAVKPIVINIRFSGADVLLYREFEAYCRQKRRDPKGQILFLIEDFVRMNKTLEKELGDHPFSGSTTP